MGTATTSLGPLRLSVPPPNLAMKPGTRPYLNSRIRTAQVSTEEDLMIGYHGYTLYQSQRDKTRSERMAEDARRGEMAAVLFHSWEALTGRGRHRAAAHRDGVH